MSFYKRLENKTLKEITEVMELVQFGFVFVEINGGVNVYRQRRRAK